MAGIPYYTIVPCCSFLGTQVTYWNFSVETGGPGLGQVVYTGDPTTINGITFMPGYCYQVTAAGSVFGAFPEAPPAVDFGPVTGCLDPQCTDCETPPPVSKYYTLNDCCTDLPIDWPANTEGLQGIIYLEFKGDCNEGDFNNTPCPNDLINLIIISIINENQLNITGCLKLTEVLITDIPEDAPILDWGGIMTIVETVNQCEECPEFSCFGCFILEDCEGVAESIYSLDPILALYANTEQSIMIAGSDVCWKVVTSDQPCECAIVTTVVRVYDDCEACKKRKGYKLVECTTGAIIYTTTDLSAYEFVFITTDCPGCWYVEPIDYIPPTDQPVVVVGGYGSCELCNATYYELVDCSGAKDSIITIDDLSGYVGKVIKIKYCPETCWEVNVTTPQEVTGTVYFDSVYTDCPECLLTFPAQCVSFTNSLAGTTSFDYIDIYGQIQKEFIAGKSTTPKLCALTWNININITVNIFGECVDGQCPQPPQPKRQVTPGYDTAACSTDYYEKVECTFSELMYKDVLAERYGISNCCPEEEMKWVIKHEMLMLDVLVNPDYECTPITTCACPVIGGTTINTVCPEVTNYILERCNEPGITEVVRIENQYDVLGNVIVIDDQCYTVLAPTNRLVTVYWTPGTIYEDCDECSPPITLPCEECIKITAVPAGGGTPVELVIPPTGTYTNGTSYYYFTIGGTDYEIYNETWDTTNPPGSWLLFAYDGGDDIGTFDQIGTCPVGTYVVDPTYFDSFIVEYCGGQPTGFVLYSVFLSTGGASGVYFTYPDCNNVPQQYNLQPSRSTTNVYICSTPGRLPGEFVQNGGTNFSVVETTVPCNC